MLSRFAAWTSVPALHASAAAHAHNVKRMEMTPQQAMYIFSVASIVFGTYSVVFGRIWFLPGEDEEQSVLLRGVKARAIGALVLSAGVVLILGNTVGYLLLVGALVLSLLVVKVCK